MSSVSFDVTPPHAPDTTWRLEAELFLPAGDPPDTVQLLLPGLTYDRRYWTAPGALDYTRHAVGAGYAVLALDRPGTGTSEHPPAEEVTVESNVEAVHQVVTALRQGAPGFPRFRHVVAVGHSLGSGIALLEAARHHDLDALVVTGLLHALGPLYPEALPALYPAAEDPLLAPTDPPENYLTTRPGRRAALYEHPAGMDPDLSAYHEDTKSTVTAGEGFTLDTIYQPEVAAGVKAPVLLVVGREDRLFGGGDVSTEDAASVVAYEQKFYTGTTDLEAFVVPDAAHSLNVHRTAPSWYAAAHEWLARRGPSHE
ncbi:alpha/beta hydrolase [Streptomyces sp. NRRL WC-3618]|uniref:alpha/beta hydrolase n=1 Tax=Streptomyces sp. NRRL WC-3618 TaxID=1519490 RepID=UPI0006AF99CC|nr:alpha/beta fold hydrolase [Streptomyces sp. NRRL WC-3618]